MDYNPYDLVPLLINDKEIYGRPFEFDSDVTDQKTMKNAFGEYVKPIKISTVCPDCGQGMMIDVRLEEPPFVPFVTNCDKCNPHPIKTPDPFVEPVASGKVQNYELDPLLHDPRQPLESDDGKTVADRLAEKEVNIIPLTDYEAEIPEVEPSEEARVVKAMQDVGMTAESDYQEQPTKASIQTPEVAIPTTSAVPPVVTPKDPESPPKPLPKQKAPEQSVTKKAPEKPKKNEGKPQDKFVAVEKPPADGLTEEDDLAE